MWICLTPISVNQKHRRLACWPDQPHGVVSGSQPQNSTASEFSEMSLNRLCWWVFWPRGSLPQACLAPQYQPSQLSGWRACMVRPPVMSSRLAMVPWGPWLEPVSPWPSPWQKMELRP